MLFCSKSYSSSPQSFLQNVSSKVCVFSALTCISLSSHVQLICNTTFPLHVHTVPLRNNPSYSQPYYRDSLLPAIYFTETLLPIEETTLLGIIRLKALKPFKHQPSRSGVEIFFFLILYYCSHCISHFPSYDSILLPQF